MARHTMLLSKAAALLITVIALTTGCTKHDPGPLALNRPPDTRLTMAPDRGDTTSLKVAFSWIGSDTDGEVSCYWTSLDGESWRRTTATETVLVLSVAAEGAGSNVSGSKVAPNAMPAGDDTPPPRGEHTFAVKAEDDSGDEDPSPAAVAFTARNTLPETEITYGPSGVCGPMVTFEWAGWDYDGIIAEYAWALYEQSIEGWEIVLERDGIPPDEVTESFGPLCGAYRFDVWSIDDAGGADPSPASRVFYPNPAVSPRLWVSCNVLGSKIFRRYLDETQYEEPTDIFEGEHLIFDWVASTDYWGEIVGYSYAYDDTSDWCSSYSLEETHFEVTPSLGEHSLYVSVVDNSGLETRARVYVNVVQVSRDYVLLVDDYDWREDYPPGAGWGTDEARDAFYDTLTMAISRPIVDWDPAEHEAEAPDVSILSGASTVIWYYDQDAAGLASAFPGGQMPSYAALAGYVRAGGNLILGGFEGISQITDEATYPISFSPADTSQRRTFVRDQLGIGHVDNTGYQANKDAPWAYGYCFYGAVPLVTSVPDGARSGFVPVYIDSVGPGGYPERGKWPVYTLQQPEGYVRAGLCGVEVPEAYMDEAFEVSAIDAFLNMNFEGEPCIVLRYSGAGQGSTCYFGFPLYYMQTAQIVEFFEELYDLLGE